MNHPILEADEFGKLLSRQAFDRILSPIIEGIRSNPQLSSEDILEILLKSVFDYIEGLSAGETLLELRGKELDGNIDLQSAGGN